jgi:hypothetical protein
MGLWRMQAVGEFVSLTYLKDLGPGSKAVQRCGYTELVAKTDLEAWVFSEMGPWDVAALADGRVVFRGGTPADGARA